MSDRVRTNPDHHGSDGTPFLDTQVRRVTNETHHRDATTGANWRGIARRRKWPLLLAAILVVVIAFWALRGRGGAEPATVPAPEHADSAAADSVITLDSAALRLAGIELVTAATSANAPLVANGTITYDANHVSVLAPRVEGRVVSVLADLGQEVRAGSVLAILESAEVGRTRGELERARAGVDVARRNFEREKRLFEQQISPQRELLEAEAQLRTAEADYASALASLRALGATVGTGARLSLASPIAGTVVERSASPGEVAGPASTLFTVADLRHVWITVDIYESDLRRVRDGAKATVTPSALPDMSFVGRVTYAGGVVDAASRTFKVRVELSNSELRLRPGMFAQVRIDAPAGGDQPGTIVVPEVAVQEVAGRQVVFVAAAQPGSFIARPVSVGSGGSGGMVVITGGVSAGERIVGRGAFQLKSELLKASFGEAH